MSNSKEYLIYTSIDMNQKHLTLMPVTCNSFPWTNTENFFFLCPHMDKNKIEAAHAGKWAIYVTNVHPNKDIFQLKKPKLWTRVKCFKDSWACVQIYTYM